jgi:hypothetical protein
MPLTPHRSRCVRLSKRSAVTRQLGERGGKHRWTIQDRLPQVPAEPRRQQCVENARQAHRDQAGIAVEHEHHQ